MLEGESSARRFIQNLKCLSCDKTQSLLRTTHGDISESGDGGPREGALGEYFRKGSRLDFKPTPQATRPNSSGCTAKQDAYFGDH